MVRIIVFTFAIIVIIDNIFTFGAIIESSTIIEHINTNLHEENTEQIDRHVLKEKVDTLTTTMLNLQEQINRFNDLYINRLDQKLTSLAVNVANLDSNVRNIQDRAHVWDTFQLHVTAWNEQIKSLDKKADLISSGQEKIMLLEGKMSFLLNLEYNSQRALNKLSNLEDKLDMFDKNMKNKVNNESPIYEEFAVRGALSTLKNVELKVDNTNLLLHQFTHRKNKSEKNRNDNNINNTTIDKHKPFICTVPREMEELMNDVASKIDVMHDKFVTDNIDDENDTEKDHHQPVTALSIDNCSLDQRIDDIITKLEMQHDILHNISSRYCVKSINIDDETDDSMDLYQKYYTEYSSSTYSTPLDDEEIAFTTIENDVNSTLNDYMIYNDVGNISLDIINRLSMIDNIMNFCEYPESMRYCDHDGNVVIQKRSDGKENFSRSWSDYKWGFGELMDGNYWMGNEAIHYLTRKATTVLRIELEDFNGNEAWAEYDHFKVGPESAHYILDVNGYKGNASDSFMYHNGSKFSTFDVKNDAAPSCCPCSISYGGGWWFKSCFESNLNGLYYDSAVRADFQGIIWEKWQGDITLSKTKMALKIIAANDIFI